MKTALRRGLILPLFFSLVLEVLLCQWTVLSAKADELYGRVRRLVTDPSGGALPGVDLKLVNMGTGASEGTVCEADGAFQFINLNPGLYSMTAKKSSLKTFAIKAIRVEPQATFCRKGALGLGTIHAPT